MATGFSPTTVFRAAVMLTCLVGVPVAAICGRSLPEGLQRLIDGGPRSLSMSGPAAPGAPAGMDLAARTVQATTAEAPAPVIEQQLRLPAAGDVGGGRAGEVAAAREAPAAAKPAPPVATVLTSYETRPAATDLGARPVLPQFDAAREPPDRLADIQARLRQLGATYYLLESWGPAQALYRFHCRVAVAGSRHYTRHFEATAAAPLAAMEDVLADVESWRRCP